MKHIVDCSVPVPVPSAGRQRPRLMSVVLPAYDESLNLVTLLPALAEELGGLADQLELLVVDDGSTDDTALLVHGLIQQGLPLRLLRNFGTELMLTAGLDVADGDVVVTMDADGQHPIATILEMLPAWREGFDGVYAVQAGRRQSQSAARRSYTKLFYWLMQRATLFVLPADAEDFRLLDRRVVLALRSLPERAQYMKGLFAWVGFRAKAVEFVPSERVHGETSYGMSRLLSLAVTDLTAFSNVPLRLVSMLGLVASLGDLRSLDHHRKIAAGHCDLGFHHPGRVDHLPRWRSTALLGHHCRVSGSRF